MHTQHNALPVCLYIYKYVLRLTYFEVQRDHSLQTKKLYSRNILNITKINKMSFFFLRHFFHTLQLVIGRTLQGCKHYKSNKYSKCVIQSFNSFIYDVYLSCAVKLRFIISKNDGAHCNTMHSHED